MFVAPIFLIFSHLFSNICLGLKDYKGIGAMMSHNCYFLRYQKYPEFKKKENVLIYKYILLVWV